MIQVILLFLAGGPCGMQMTAVRHDLAELEQDFLVVNWEQPGSGKSYALRARENLSRRRILGKRAGHLFGDRAAGSYHAVIDTGQMVDFLETERQDYDNGFGYGACKLRKHTGEKYGLVSESN